MGRPSTKWAEGLGIPAWALRLPQLRQYWRAENRKARQAEAERRAKRKTRDKKRAKCRCEAYPWPHRPGGGFCRWPDPPLERYQRKPGGRPYRKRYAGLLRQIARANRLHPIRDRGAIEALMPQALALAKQLHRQHPTYKYRNMVVESDGRTIRITGQYQTAGPMM